MAKIFVSYSRKDSATARKIIQALKDIGQDVWVDWEDIPPASDWLQQIFRGIEAADAFIFLISPDSAASEVCKVEVTHAAQNEKRIIPVEIRQVPPKDTIEIIRKLNWTFMSDKAKFAEGLNRIKEAIELDFEWVEEHSRLQLRALDWDRRKEASLLLRGRDLWTVRQKVVKAEVKDPKPTKLQKTYVDHSSRNERRLLILLMLATFAIVAMAFLSYTAVQASKRANENALKAIENQRIAEVNANKAAANAKKAIKEKQAAEKAKQAAIEARDAATASQNLAAAQRSAARAQIYQFRPGELYTSTLLAIASWQTSPSMEAEEIIRANISLLPLPVNQMTHAGRINSLEFNAAGDLFVTAGADGTICVWQVVDGQKVYCADSPGPVNDAVFSPIDEIVLTGDDKGVVKIVNPSVKTVESPIEIGTAIRDVDIDKNGRFAALTSDNGRITILDLKTRQKSGFDLNAIDIRFAEFSPNGLQIATGSKDGIVSIWNLNQQNNIINTRKHKGEVLAIEFSPNNKYLISGGVDGAVVIIDPKTGTELSRCRHNDQVKDIAFDPNNNWFVTASNDRTVRVWDINSCEQLLLMSQSNFVQKVIVSTDGQWIATTGDDRTVRVWSSINGAELFQIPLKGKGTTLRLTIDGKYLIAGDQNGNIYIWDITSIPTPIKALQFKGLTSSATYSPTGDRIAVSDDRRIWFLNPQTFPTLTTTPPGNALGDLLSNITKVVIGTNGERLGALTTAKDIVIYNTKTTAGKTLKLESAPRAFVFSPDERQIIIGDSAGGLQVWNAVSGLFVNTPVSYQQRITAMTATSDLLAVAVGDEVHILNINTLDELAQPLSNSNHEMLVFSPNGTWLAGNNSNGQIHLWKQENGKFSEPRSFTSENVSSMAFHPAGKLLAIGAVDIVYLIDPVTLQEYARIPHTGTVNSVSFSPDGSTLMTASNKVIQFWDVGKIPALKEDNLIEAACGRVIANFNESQWDILFETEPFRLLCPNLPKSQ